MGFIALIIIGTAAGFLATRFMKIETDVITTVVVGIAGALVGWLILRGFLTMMSWMSGFVGAVLGAVFLLWLWQKYFKK